MHKVFYHITRMPKDVPAESAVLIDIAEVYSELFPLLKKDGEFLGIIDEAGTTLQMMYHENDDTYWTEVPCPERDGSYGKLLSFDEAEDLIKSLNGCIQKSGYDGFSFSSW
ncbi:MAG: hypothetical protein P8179_19715 [Candidatus Thiodiazotropha sp.]|jgi:hypothetical protein